jgi:hypothetical protein
VGTHDEGSRSDGHTAVHLERTQMSVIRVYASSSAVASSGSSATTR